MQRFELHNSHNPLRVDLKFVLLKNIYAPLVQYGTVMNDLTRRTRMIHSSEDVKWRRRDHEKICCIRGII